MKYTIEIREIGTNKVVETIGNSANKRALERTERGVNINLNHAQYYTQIVEKTNA